jgi:hypothetical protein
VRASGPGKFRIGPFLISIPKTQYIVSLDKNRRPLKICGPVPGTTAGPGLLFEGWPAQKLHCSSATVENRALNSSYLIEDPDQRRMQGYFDSSGMQACKHHEETLQAPLGRSGTP